MGWDEGQMDLASAHMTNDTLGFLRQQIKFVLKEANPPTLIPQANQRFLDGFEEGSL